jgi:putative cardiolipin synthase
VRAVFPRAASARLPRHDWQRRHFARCGGAATLRASRAVGSPFPSRTDAEALAARLALADAAQRSLDVQYFIWNKDMSAGSFLSVCSARPIGRARAMLLDDLGVMPTDATLLAIDSHPNIEVRMFNPVALRSPRLLGMVADFGRINKRMHNKSFTADGQVSIVGRPQYRR